MWRAARQVSSYKEDSTESESSDSEVSFNLAPDTQFPNVDDLETVENIRRNRQTEAAQNSITETLNNLPVEGQADPSAAIANPFQVQPVDEDTRQADLNLFEMVDFDVFL